MGAFFWTKFGRLFKVVCPLLGGFFNQNLDHYLAGPAERKGHREAIVS